VLRAPATNLENEWWWVPITEENFSVLKVAELREEFSLYPHQQRAVKKMHENGGHLLIAHGTGLGKCLERQTPIFTDRGMHPIGDLFCGDLPDDVDEEVADPPAPMWTLGVDDCGRTVRTRVEKLFRMRIPLSEPMLRIKTRMGVEFTVSLNEPLPHVTSDGSVDWAPAQDWVPGNYVGVPRCVSVPFEVDAPAWLVEVLSWQIAEGSEAINTPRANSATVTQKDTAVLDRLKSLLEHHGGFTAGITYERRKGTAYLRVCDARYRNLLEEYGHTWGHRSKDKRLPPDWVYLRDDLAKLCLRCLFDAEAYAGKDQVEFSSASRVLIDQVAFMLLRFGIRAKVSSKWACATNSSNPKRRKYWRLTLLGENMRRFADHIGFGVDYKVAALAVAAEQPPHRWSATGIDVSNVLARMRSMGVMFAARGTSRRATTTVTSVANVLDVASRLESPPTHDPSRGGTAGKWAERTAAAYAAHEPEIKRLAANLRALAESDLTFDKVVEIEEVWGDRVIYDLQTSAHNFLAGHNIGLVHNSVTSLAAAEDALDGRGSFRTVGGRHLALAVVPAGLRVNFVENVRKFTKRKVEIVDNMKELDFLQKRLDEGKPVPPYLVMSWDLLRQDPQKVRALQPRMVIFDEMDTAKDPKSSNYAAARIVRQGVPGSVGLAASFVSNTPDDLPVLLSITSDGKVPHNLPFRDMVTTKIDNVKSLFGGTKPVFHVDRPDVIQQLGQFLDFADPNELDDMPAAVTEYVPVEMSREQHKFYQDQMKKAPKSLVARIIRGQWTGSSGRNRAISARQAAQSTFNKYGESDKTLDTSSKVQKMVQDAQTHLQESKRNKIVIYSNFVDAGVRPIHMALKRAGIPHSVFIGQGHEVDDTVINEAERTQAYRDFQEDRTRVIVVSGAGAKGLNLKTGTMFMAAEGHFNPEIIRQAQARIRRLGAHKDVPKEERKVFIRRYLSVEPAPGLFKRIKRAVKGEPKHHKTTDEWVYDVARAKHFTNEGVRIALQGRIPLMPGQKPPKGAKMAQTAPHPGVPTAPPTTSTRDTAHMKAPKMETAEKRMRGPFKYISKHRSPTTGKWVYKYPEAL